jgi:hypothetical protein
MSPQADIVNARLEPSPGAQLLEANARSGRTLRLSRYPRHGARRERLGPRTKPRVTQNHRNAEMRHVRLGVKIGPCFASVPRIWSAVLFSFIPTSLGPPARERAAGTAGGANCDLAGKVRMVQQISLSRLRV